MWLVLFLIRVARPMALGDHRLAVGPSSTIIRLTNNLSSSTPEDLEALSNADCIVFLISPAAFFGVNWSVLRAVETGRPLTRSATSLAFRADMRAYLWVASHSITFSPSWLFCPQRDHERSG